MEKQDDININNNSEDGDCEKDENSHSSDTNIISKSVRDNMAMIQQTIQNRYLPEMAKQFQRPNGMFQEATKPLAETNQLASEVMSSFNSVSIPAIKEDTTRRINELFDFSKVYIPTIKIELPDIPLLQLEDSLAAAISEMQNTISQAFTSPVIKWMDSFDWSSVFQPILDLPSIHIDSDKFDKFLLQEMYEAHWFPGTIWEWEFSQFMEIVNIIEHTRASKNRTRKIDKSVFAYYTGDKVEEIKKSWRSLELPEYLMRLLHQSVQAYHRREYGITVIVLSTQWEGIIYHKMNKQHEWRKEKKTSEFLHNLSDENDYPEIFKSYYDDFIIYSCSSAKDTIPDVPGRNSSAHSFFETYPNRKAALNAILFTDFLLNLRPTQKGADNSLQ